MWGLEKVGPWLDPKVKSLLTGSWAGKQPHLPWFGPRDAGGKWFTQHAVPSLGKGTLGLLKAGHGFLLKAIGGAAALGLGTLWAIGKMPHRTVSRRMVTGKDGVRVAVETSTQHDGSLLPVIALLLVAWYLLGLAFPMAGPVLKGGVQSDAYACATSLPTGGMTGVAAGLGKRIHDFTGQPPTVAQETAAVHRLLTWVGKLWGTFVTARDTGATPTQPRPLQNSPAAYGCCPTTGSGTVPASYTPPAGPGILGLTAEQTTNARTIIAVGIGMGVPTYGETIAVATAMQESGLRDLDYGDRDSLGLFQQRPSQGWGTPAQVTDPTYAATAFYTHLLAVPGWSSLPLTVAAQDVQRSATPDAYARWQPLAQQLVSAYADTPGVEPTGFTGCTSGGGAVPTGYSPGASVALQRAYSQLGVPYVWGGGNADGPTNGGWDCSGLASFAYQIRPRATTYTLLTMGTRIDPSQVQPGDLVFPDAGHVGIAVGGGEYIEAPHTGSFVRVDSYGVPWAVVRLTVGRTA